MFLFFFFFARLALHSVALLNVPTGRYHSLRRTWAVNPGPFESIQQLLNSFSMYVTSRLTLSIPQKGTEAAATLFWTFFFGEWEGEHLLEMGSNIDSLDAFHQEEHVLYLSLIFLCARISSREILFHRPYVKGHQPGIGWLHDRPVKNVFSPADLREGSGTRLGCMPGTFCRFIQYSLSRFLFRILFCLFAAFRYDCLRVGRLSL